MGVSDNIEISKALPADVVATERISRGAAKSRSSTQSKLKLRRQNHGQMTRNGGKETSYTTRATLTCDILEYSGELIAKMKEEGVAFIEEIPSLRVYLSMLALRVHTYRTSFGCELQDRRVGVEFRVVVVRGFPDAGVRTQTRRFAMAGNVTKHLDLQSITNKILRNLGLSHKLTRIPLMKTHALPQCLS